MTISASMLARDNAFMMADLPDTLTWGTATLACAVNEIVRGQRNLEDGGIWPDDAVQFVILASAIVSPIVRPTAGKTITYKTVVYRIEQVRTSADDSCLTLTCVEKN